MLLGLLLLLPAAASRAAEKCPAPRLLTFHVEKEIRRDTVGFTEGLEVHDGAIFESTGDFFGDSRINRIDPVTGHVTAVLDRGKAYFGEGLTFFGGKTYQMTYREHRVFVFDSAMRKLAEYSNPREGWGLTHDDSQLIASDGSQPAVFPLAQGFHCPPGVAGDGEWPRPEQSQRAGIRPGARSGPMSSPTGMWCGFRPLTGCVEASADLRPLRDRMSPADRRAIDSDENFVPNGIAYDPGSGLFTLTGKYWPLLFSGRFSEVN